MLSIFLRDLCVLCGKKYLSFFQYRHISRRNLPKAAVIEPDDEPPFVVDPLRQTFEHFPRATY